MASMASRTRAGELSARELTEACLDRIDVTNDRLNAFTVLMQRELCAAFDQADEDERPELRVAFHADDELDPGIGHRLDEKARHPHSAGPRELRADVELDGDLERFKEFIESRGSETGSWRGEVREPGRIDSGNTSAALVLTFVRWYFLVRALDRRAVMQERRSTWQSRMIIGWSGMRGSVSLAAALGMSTTAEGVECAELAKALTALGCTNGQGFHFAEPLDADAALDYWMSRNA